MKKECICNSSHFVSLNENTEEYSGIQIAIYNNILRVRASTPVGRYSDVIAIEYCPLCGRKLEGDIICC